MDQNDNQGDFQSALMTEFGVASPSDDAPTPPAPTPTSDDDGEKTPPPAPEAEVPSTDDKTTGDEPPKPQGGEDDAPKETEEEKANREGEEAVQTEEPKPLTAEDIRKAIAEDRTESQQRIDQVHSAREEIISKVYPEGIDQNIYDTDGKIIKTAQDIVDRGLINERTGEAYTYEEASSFMLEASRKMAEQVDELNSWAENVAEKNISLHESNQRVMAEWGETLKAMPKLAEQLAEKYISTQLTFDKTGSYITNMATTPEDFYSLVMPVYQKLGEALAAQKETETQQQAEEQRIAQENEQAERTGLPPQRGTSETKANTGSANLDALIDELNKG